MYGELIMLKVLLFVRHFRIYKKFIYVASQVDNNNNNVKNVGRVCRNIIHGKSNKNLNGRPSASDSAHGYRYDDLIPSLLLARVHTRMRTRYYRSPPYECMRV